MWRAAVEPAWSLDAWRGPARRALQAGIAPDAIEWNGDAAGLLGGAPVDDAPTLRDAPRVPGAFLRLAEAVLAHRDPLRHALLYRVLWRIVEGEADLLDFDADPEVRRLREREKAVRRDVHKMHAFVRFREVPGEPGAFVAWYEPDHCVVDLAAPFFVRRFASMRWAILTPYRRAVWNGAALVLDAGGDRADVPADDAGETLWRRYYTSIFNPARANPKAMLAEMPRRFWKHLPEALDVPLLLREAAPRVQAMVARAPEPPRRRMPPRQPTLAAPVDGLDAVHAAVRTCRACPLWSPATQAVPGEGARDARIVIVGEQPGDAEDLRGRPFVGPAGRLLRRAMADAGLDRDACYLTNAVKHFRFETRGRRRIHQRATTAQQAACRQWLDAELAAIRPDRIVALGATAAKAVLGRDVAIMQARGHWHDAGEARVLATVHPSWVLRQPPDAFDAAYRMLVDDLARVVTAA